MYQIELPPGDVHDDEPPSTGQLVLRHIIIGTLYVAGMCGSLFVVAVASFGESTCPSDSNSRGSLTTLRMAVLIPTLCMVGLCLGGAASFRFLRARPAHAAFWTAVGALTALAGAILAATIHLATWCF